MGHRPVLSLKGHRHPDLGLMGHHPVLSLKGYRFLDFDLKGPSVHKTEGRLACPSIPYPLLWR